MTVMLDLQGLELTLEEHEILRHPQVGGVILFSRNYSDSDQLLHLIRSIRRVSRQYLLIAVDQEGGRVQRFQKEFTRLPALATVGKMVAKNTKQACYLAEQHAWLMAAELLAMDVDFSFAPVLDLAKGVSQVIGDRAFHADPKIVTVLAEAYISGLNQAGMASVGKHFPGHGSVAIDSHISIPVDSRDFASIAQEDLIPFKACSSILSGIMPAHVVYSAVDSLPAGFSEFWLQKILRQQLNFSGAIFSDDLSMQGASQLGDMINRARQALKAGCDMILVCNDRPNALKVLNDLETNGCARDPQTAIRLQKIRGKRHLTRAELRESSRWWEAVNVTKQLGS